MIVSCPNCKTKFKLSFAQQRDIRDTSNTLKCGDCQHMWQGSDKQVEQINNTNINNLASLRHNGHIASEASETMLREVFANKIYNEERYFYDNNNRKLVYAFSILLFIYSLLFAIINKNSILNKLPGLEPLYAVTGLYQTSGLEFAEVRIAKSTLSDEIPFVITGYIVNKSDKPIRSPDIRIQFVDEGGSVIESFSADLPNKSMLPKEKSKITQKIQHIPDNSHKIIMDIGNYLEFFIR